MIKKYFNWKFFFLVVRFGLVGIFNTGVGYGLFALFITFLNPDLDFDVFLATSLSHIIASTIAFFPNKFFTFNSKDKIKKELPKYILVSCFQLTFSLISNKIIIVNIGINEYLGGLITTILLVMLSFVLHLFISFSSTVKKYQSSQNQQEK